MTINRYLVEGVLRDIQKGRRVVVVLAGPLFLETSRLWNLLAQLTQEAPDLLEGISSHRTNGQDPLQCESTGGRVTLCTLHSLDRMRCANDEAEGVALLCRKCLDWALEDGSICTGCEQYYPPGPPFRIVRWLT